MHKEFSGVWIMAWKDDVIDSPSEKFQTFQYRGNSSSTESADRNLTFDGYSDLQPDLVIGKNIDTAVTGSPKWFDSTRGAGSGKGLASDLTSGPGYNESTMGWLNAFNSDGFGVRAGDGNGNGRWFWDRGEGGGDKYNVAAWKANGGTTSSNTDGAITSTVQVDADAKFSIVSYTGNSNNPSSVGHGLGVKPEFYIIRQYSAGNAWKIYHSHSASDPEDHVLEFNANARENNAIWNDTGPTSSVINFTDHGAANQSGQTYIAYCWATVKGYSSFGRCMGSGATTSGYNSYVWCGFRPAMVWYKNVENGSSHWLWWHDKWNRLYGRLPDQYYTTIINANGANYTGFNASFTNSGFRVWDSEASVGQDGAEYIYAAWAAQPFVTSSGVPGTAY